MKILVLSNQLSSNKSRVYNPVIKNLNDAILKKGIELTEYSIDVGAHGMFAYFRLLLKLIELRMFSIKYDRYHVHFGGVQGLLVALFFRHKTIISFHGTDLHGGSPRGFKGWVKSKINVFLSRISIILSGKCTVVSRNLLQYIPKSFLKKVVIIPTGVDEKHFLPLEKVNCRLQLGLNPNTVYLLFSDISSSSVKRRDIALKVVDLLNADDKKYELLIMNQVDYSQVPIYLYASDYLILTSDKEGSPNIVKEALYCKLKVMSTDVGDVSDYVTKPERGFIFSSNDPYEIKSEIQKYIKTIEENNNSKLNSHDLNLSIENIADEYISIYEK